MIYESLLPKDKAIVDSCFSDKTNAVGLSDRLYFSYFNFVERVFTFFAKYYIKFSHPLVYQAQLDARTEGGLAGEYQWRRLSEIDWLIKKYHIQSAMEFGSGTSSIMFGSLLKNRDNFLTVDESGYWQSRMLKTAKSFKNYISTHESKLVIEVDKTGEVVSHYESYPLKKVDLVYIDGPTNHTDKVIPGFIKDPKNLLPNTDIEQLIEAGLLPKVIAVDGRRSTVRRIMQKYGHLYDCQLKTNLMLRLTPRRFRPLYHSIFIRCN